MLTAVPCRWKEGVTARKKLRRQMRAFPAAPCCVDVNNQLGALAPSAECPIAEENLAKGLLDLGHAGKLGISCTRSARPGAGWARTGRPPCGPGVGRAACFPSRARFPQDTRGPGRHILLGAPFAPGPLV